MSDEFMNGVGGEPENTGGEPQGYADPAAASQTYGEPEHASEEASSYSQPEQNYYSQPDYNQAQYDPNNLGKPDYSQMNYNQADNGAQYQQPYGQQYQQPGMATKSDSVGFGIASLVLGIISIFTFFCCINYILAILAIIFGIVQIVRGKKKGLAVGGIVTAIISVVGATIFWVFAGIAGASASDEMGPLQDYMEEYLQEYYDNQNDDAF